MIRFTTLLLVIAVTVNSCQSRSEEIVEAFKTVDKSLQKSSAAIDSANEALLDKIGQNGCAINAKADSVYTFIKNIKKEMEDHAAKSGAAPALEDLETSNSIMIKNKKATLLFTQLADFNQAALNCNTSTATKKEISEIFGTGFFKDSNKFNELYFKNTPTVAALTMLSSFQNKIKNIQIILLTSAVKAKGTGSIK
jgi:hypothetical protein